MSVLSCSGFSNWGLETARNPKLNLKILFFSLLCKKQVRHC